MKKGEPTLVDQYPKLWAAIWGALEKIDPKKSHAKNIRDHGKPTRVRTKIPKI